MNIAAPPSIRGYDSHGHPADRAPANDVAFDVREMLALVWRARWLMLLGGGLGIALALLYLASLGPRYTAAATVMFDSSDGDIVGMEEVVARPANGGLQNQIAILRSSSLMARVVQQLHLQRLPEFNPRLGADSDSRRRSGVSGWRDWVPWTVLADLGIVAAAEAGGTPDAALAERERQAARRTLLNHLELRPVPDSRVIEIAFTAGDARLAADVVNAVAGQYIIAQLDARLAATRAATVWLTERVADLRGNLEAAEAAVGAFRTRIAESTGQGAAVTRQQLEALNQTLSGVAAQRSAAEIRHRRAVEVIRDIGSIATVMEFQQSDLIRRYRQEEAELTSDRTALAKLVPPGHERLQAIDSRIEDVRDTTRAEAARIAAALGNEYRIASENERSLRAKVKQLEQQLQEQGQAEVELRQLEREVEASRIIYEAFLGRLKETTQQEKLEDPDAIILSPAEAPSVADDAADTLVLAMGGAAGTLLGLVVVFLLDLFNTSFRGIDQVQAATGLTVVGVVPAVERRQSRRRVVETALGRPSSSLAEAIRNLRTSLFLAGRNPSPKVVMFASSVPAEGKSTTSILLALMSAQMGKSAIIVECDLRKPSLHTLLETDDGCSEGLLGVLCGTTTLAEACQEDTETGLHFLTGRPDRPLTMNAADILSSARFREIIERLRAAYDLVILDAPPVLSVSDARIISGLADAVLYCVEWDTTPRGAVMEGLREFSMVGQEVTGIVLTMVDERKASSFGYGGTDCGYYRGRYADHYAEA